MPETIKEQDSAKLYEQDMVKYLIIVNRRRAFPEAIDGFKPVQRRIIYDMFKQGATSYSKRIKSSAIFGDVMKLFHGHGDCIDYHTKLFTLDYDTVEIGELYDRGIEKFETLGIDPSTGKVIPVVAHSFRVGQYSDTIYHIKLSNGFELKCTSNHPILTKKNGFVQTKDLNPNTRIVSGPITIKYGILKNGSYEYRPCINGKYIQNIVGEFFNNIPEGYVKHHVDENKFNNHPDNIQILSKQDHFLIHYNSNNSYKEGLAKGRDEMFQEGGIYREQTKAKNKLLLKLTSENNIYYKFIKEIHYLEDHEIPVTEENYTANFANIYNLPKLETVYNKYHKSFNELAFGEKPFKSISEEYEELKPKPGLVFQKNETTIGLKYSALFKKINKFLDNNISIDYPRFKDFIKNSTYSDLTEEEFNSIFERYKFAYPYIENIWVEKLPRPIPMYDFTVNGYENVIIPTSPLPLDEKDPTSSYICIHNSSIYGAIEPMVSWYKIKMPLIAGKGNWGNLTGDKPAAARYTEAGLSDFCYDCVIGELKESKGVVDWVDNYSRTTVEPEYLPVKLPLLLINGSFGIGVGMNTNIPTHNLVEVCEATRQLIKDPSVDVVLVPDHCQPCKIIADKKEIKKISHTGMGKYKLRGEVEVGEEKGYPMLYIKSLPDNVNTSMITNKLEDMIEKKELPMIRDIKDATAATVDIRIQLKKGSDPYYVKQILYTKTQVQSTISVNFEVVNGTNPHRYSYKEYLLSFIEQRKMTKFRLYCNKLKDANTRYHQLTAYIKLYESGKIDEVIQLVKKQKKQDENEIIEFLIKKVGLTDLQAKFILGTDILHLSEAYYKKYKVEFKELQKKISVYENAITDDGSFIANEIDQELQDIEKKYGSPRLCKLVKDTDENNIPKGTFKIVITRRNYIRKIADTDKIGSVRGDDPKFVLKVDNAENILLFDNKGKVFKLPIYKIGLCDRNNGGLDIRVLCKNLTADIIGVFYEPIIKKVAEGKHKHYFVIATKNNTIKKLNINDFLNVNASGLLYSKIKDDDEVTGIVLAPAELDVVVFSDSKALRTPLSQIPEFKRNATGSKAMSTDKPIEGISVVYPNTNYIVVLTNKGKVNKFPISTFTPHKRAGKGINVIKLGSGDSIKAIYGANDTDKIRIVTSESVKEIQVSDIKSKSAVAVGESAMLNGAKIIRSDLIY